MQLFQYSASSSSKSTAAHDSDIPVTPHPS